MYSRNFFLVIAMIASIACPCHAFPMPTYDLTTLCYRSSDVVEATLIRHHQPVQEGWKDEFTVVVLNSLEGSSYKAGDQVNHLDLTVFNPAQNNQHCILFLNSYKSVPYWIDMLFIDDHSRVYRYFQDGNPGGMIAGGGPEQEHPMVAEERALIVTKWAAAKKLKTPPYQVLHQIER